MRMPRIFLTLYGLLMLLGVSIPDVSSAEYDGKWIGILKSDASSMCGFETHPITATIRGSNVEINTRDFDSEVKLTGDISNKGDVDFWGEANDWQIDADVSHYIDKTAKISAKIVDNTIKGDIDAGSGARWCYTSFILKRAVDPKKIAEEKRKKDAEKQNQIAELKSQKEELERQRIALEQERQKLATQGQNRQKQTAHNRIVQESLKELGLYSGVVDGKLGQKTTLAIGKWHKSKGRNESSNLNEIQLSNLKLDANQSVKLRQLNRQKNLKNIEEERKEKLRVQEKARQMKIEKKRKQDELAILQKKEEKKRREESLLKERQNLIAKFTKNSETAFLFKGNQKNLVFLFNEVGNPKNSVRGLDGKIIFENKLASICSFWGIEVDATIKDFVLESLKVAGLTNQKSLKFEKCSLKRKIDADLIIFNRDVAERQKINSLEKVLISVSKKEYIKFSVFDIDTHFDTLKSNKVKSARIRSQIKESLLKGVGLMLFNGPTKKVCATTGLTKDLSPKFLKQLKNKSPVLLKSVKLNSINYESIENHFINIKREKCGFLLASSIELNKIIPALERDGITHSMHHNWIDIKKNTGDSKSKSATKQSKETKSATNNSSNGSSGDSKSKSATKQSKETKEELKVLEDQLREKAEELRLLENRKKSSEW
jgi:hypothetical protein